MSKAETTANGGCPLGAVSQVLTMADPRKKGQTTMTSKDEERKALAKIRKIVEGLGADSYIATAMCGVLEDAEQNIDEDAAYSWFDRFESCNKKLADARAEAETATKKAEQIENHLKAVESKVLTTTENMTIQHLLHKFHGYVHGNDAEFKQTILAFCDTPNDVAFLSAVENHKQATKTLESIEEMLTLLDSQVRPTYKEN